MERVEIYCPIHGTVNVFRAVIDGQVIQGPCPKCHEEQVCAEEAARAEAVKQRESDPSMQVKMHLVAADVPEDKLECRFANFDVHSDLLNETVSYAKEVASGYKRSLVLLGPTGVGKTHLGCAVLAAAALQGRSIRYTKEPRLLRDIRSTFGRKTGPTEAEVFKGFITPEVLVIDELSDEPLSKYEQTIIDDLVDDRITRNKATVLISNATADAYKSHLSDKVRSRLAERGATFQIVGDDWRRKH